MASKIGLCIQCDKRLMVADTKGKLTSSKPDACQAVLVFESGSKMKISICEACSRSPNLEKIMEASLHPGSGLLGSPGMEYVSKNLGTPTGLTNIKKRRA